MTRGDGRSLTATKRVCYANSLSKRSLRRMRRPVVIIQSEWENLNALNTKVVVPLTSNTVHADERGNVFLAKKETGLSRDSVALVHQIVVVDKFRLEEKISHLPKTLLAKIEAEIDYVTKE